MNNNETRVPTLEECLELWNKKTWLEKEVDTLELECVGERARVEHLKETEYNLRVTSAVLCYNLSKLFEIIGKMVDAEKTHLASNIADTFEF